MVFDVTGDDEGQGARRDGVVAGDAGPAPSFGCEGVQEVHRRGANGAELFDMGGPGDSVGIGIGGEQILYRNRGAGLRRRGRSRARGRRILVLCR